MSSGGDTDCTAEDSAIETVSALSVDSHSVSSHPLNHDHTNPHICHLGHCPALIENQSIHIQARPENVARFIYRNLASEMILKDLLRPPITRAAI